MTGQRLGRLTAAGDLDAVRSAIESSPRLLGSTVERAGQGGWTPLHAAVAEGGDNAPEIVRVLLEAGADVNATTDDGAGALDISRVAAARHRRADISRATADDAVADLLVSHGATD